MVFANFNPMAFFGFGGGGEGGPDDDETGETKLQDLPVEVHVQVWEYLPLNDHKGIRQQCRQFRFEINHIVGVHAILMGPKPWKEWNFIDEGRCLLSLANPETIRAKENLNWIENSVVRSLNMSRLAGVACEPTTLIWNPHVLHRLVLQLDENMTPKAKVIQMLNSFNNLRIINVSCRCRLKRLITPACDMESYELYRNQCISLAQDIRQSLVPKIRLKELTISARIDALKLTGFGRRTFMGTPAEPTGDLIEYPSTIQVLNIKFQILKNSDLNRAEITSWKALLNCQTQLTKLSVNLGFVHWTYFLNVIQNNKATLKKLSLHLANWQVVRTRANWDQIVPVTQQLDWIALLPDTLYLTSLKVKMSSGPLIPSDTRPHVTRNFRDLELNFMYLETLELRSVFLGPEDFSMIFDLESLKNVMLDHWSTVGLPEQELTEIARTSSLPILRSLLTGNGLERIVLKDLCVRFCPQYLRDLISAVPNYGTFWPFFSCHYLTYGSVACLLPGHLTITKKPETEIIEPLFDEIF